MNGLEVIAVCYNRRTRFQTRRQLDGLEDRATTFTWQFDDSAAALKRSGNTAFDHNFLLAPVLPAPRPASSAVVSSSVVSTKAGLSAINSMVTSMKARTRAGWAERLP